ncbi:peptidoglycan DD-metalloendopeptidase family protein [Culicoidibacter larvae]|uniref:Fibronectin type-III domain-containing protein n=1 Tax=Culicoidibacter larvae TaxID=2579976 RepID=A0A5R8QCI9_9FIRM|nr:peptidoglycan DD-metalloendopeptidase family protein [Culicoidibacter larvae]TLG74291.1 hypothetical protein FEZ08_06180 [Culicoidibacter larvae]
MKLNPLKLSIVGAIIGGMILVSVPVRATQNYNPATMMPLQKNQKVLIAQTNLADIEQVSSNYNVLEIPVVQNADGTLSVTTNDEALKEQIATINKNNRSVFMQFNIDNNTIASDANTISTELLQLTETYGFDGLSIVTSSSSIPAADTLHVISDAAKIIRNNYASQGANFTTILYTDAEQLQDGAALYDAVAENQNKYSYIAVNSTSLTALDDIIHNKNQSITIDADRLIITDLSLGANDIDNYIYDLMNNADTVRGVSTKTYETSSFNKLAASTSSMTGQFINNTVDVKKVNTSDVTENSAVIDLELSTNNLSKVQSIDVIDKNNTVLATKDILNSKLQVKLSNLSKNTIYDQLQAVIWYKDNNNNLASKTIAIPSFTTALQATQRQTAALQSTTEQAVVDEQAPSQPGSLVVSNVTSHGALLTWEPSTDNIEVSKYIVTVTSLADETVKQFETVDSFYTLSGLSAEASYKITVQAQDSSNNTSTAAATQILTEKVEAWDANATYKLGARVIVDGNVYENQSLISVNSIPTPNDSTGINNGWLHISGDSKTAIPDWNVEGVYPSGYVVFKDNNFWQANAIATGNDVPGNSNKWQVTTHVPEDIFEERLPSFKSPIRASYTVSAEYGGYAGHIGTDLAVPVGTEVYPVIKGTVVYTAGGAVEGDNSANGGYGNVIAVAHTVQGVQYVSVYGHLSSINVSVGDTVTTNTIIGLSGNTGMSTGAHLHIELLKNATQFDLNKNVRIAQALDCRTILPL